jgi:hypothetical protein
LVVLVVEFGVAFKDVLVAVDDLFVLLLDYFVLLFQELPFHFGDLVAQVVQQKFVLLLLKQCRFGALF